jgi:vancomycin resistance protein YoaR
MRFRNDTPYPVYIRGRAGPGWIRFDLYTVRSGRTVTFSKPAVSNVDRAGDGPERTTSLPAGTSERVEWPADGMTVVVVRTVRDADGSVIHVDRIVTRYHRVDGVVLIGTG